MRLVDIVFWENIIAYLTIDPVAKKVSLFNWQADIQEYLRDNYQTHVSQHQTMLLQVGYVTPTSLLDRVHMISGPPVFTIRSTDSTALLLQPSPTYHQ